MNNMLNVFLFFFEEFRLKLNYLFLEEFVFAYLKLGLYIIMIILVPSS